MNATAGRLPQTVVGTLVVVGCVTAAALGLVAPRFLLIDPAVAKKVLTHGAWVTLGVLVVSCVTAWLQMRRYRFTIRALGLGSRTLEAEELGALDRAPSKITITTMLIAACGAVLMLVPPVRPKGVDPGLGVTLVLLSITFCATATLPLYVIIRRRFARAMQLAPEEPMRELLERIGSSERPHRRMIRRVLLAVLTPAAMIGFGVGLLAYTHVRAFEAQERLNTATAIAQAALEPVPGALPSAGEIDAARAAAEHGFLVRLYPGSTAFQIERATSGRVTVTVPLDVGFARIAFFGTTGSARATTIIVVALVAALLAGILGARVGKTLDADLAQATRQVQLLGTETVLRGSTRVARPARFAIVAALGEAIEKLTDRFRVFAYAQEKAIEAREAARRMRGLLFASVSHDLKSPLNAVLGFADLVQEQRLAAAQIESLDVIKYRGRELLGLIQTILDAARVEAGQLVLEKKRARLDDLVLCALESCRAVAGSDVPINLSVEPLARDVLVDPDRIVDALVALIRHAVRTTTRGSVRIQGAIAPAGRQVLVDIEAPTRAIPADKLSRLLLPDGESTMPRSAGGLALGLSLARSLVVLHGGQVLALDTPSGVVLRLSLPILENVVDASADDPSRKQSE